MMPSPLQLGFLPYYYTKRKLTCKSAMDESGKLSMSNVNPLMAFLRPVLNVNISSLSTAIEC